MTSEPVMQYLNCVIFRDYRPILGNFVIKKNIYLENFPGKTIFHE